MLNSFIRLEKIGFSILGDSPNELKDSAELNRAEKVAAISFVVMLAVGV
jgi:hypothetical protein